MLAPDAKPDAGFLEDGHFLGVHVVGVEVGGGEVADLVELEQDLDRSREGGVVLPTHPLVAWRRDGSGM